MTFWSCPLSNQFIQTYDYICSLHDEILKICCSKWTFLFRSRFTKVKCLYIVGRYVPFFLIASDIGLTLTPNENPKACRMFINIYSCFFVIRTYALWGNNRIVLITMLFTLFDWRSTRYPLHAALLKHNIFYYACGLFFSALNVLVPLAFPNSSYHSFLEDLEVFILAILATRMHLHLWHIDNNRREFDTAMSIPMPNMSPAA
ncbi:hypothetical protein BDR05DRAFT_1016343 [Suillus weaverae]|nr:hypothetical protein BDR05DRAFT_1016343 [Suillus weaverae]